MIKEIKNKIQMAALIAPAYAAETLSLSPKGTGMENLTKATMSGILSVLIQFLIVVVALVFFFVLVIGGLKWITSGGDEKKVAAARSEITNALIGLVIVFASWAIMNLIGRTFGIDINNLVLPTIN